MRRGFPAKSVSRFLTNSTITGRTRPAIATALPQGLRFLTAALIPQLFDFPADMDRVAAEPNRLNTQALVRYYEREWREINR